MFRVWVFPALVMGGAVPWAAVRLFMRAPGRRVAVEALFAGYLVTLLFMVIVAPVSARPGDDPSVWASINLVPSHTVVELVRDFPQQIVGQLVGNVLLFVPLGFLLPRLFAGCRRFSRTAIAGLVASVGIELVQFVLLVTNTSHRKVDVDDVILNVAGACLGYLAWRLGARASRVCPGPSLQAS